MSTEVVIIESRSYLDIYKNTHEGKTLQEVLRMQGVSADYYEVTTKEQLAEALSFAVEESVKYVHISAHGCKDGFALTKESDFIDWYEFDKLAWPHLKNKCIAFSSCDVGKGVGAIFNRHKTLCNAVIAPVREILWSEGLVAYSVFYHQAAKLDSTIDNDLRLLNSITSPGTFKVIKADTVADKPIYAL